MDGVLVGLFVLAGCMVTYWPITILLPLGILILRAIHRRNKNY